MEYLSTAFALLALLAGVLFAADARRSARGAEGAERRLKALVGRVTGVEGDCASLTAQLQRLRGSFYAFKAAIEDGPAELAGLDRIRAAPWSRDAGAAPHVDATGNVFAPDAAFCPNYGQAQIDGPLSPAALCACGYCAAMRARREEFRKNAVPRTAQGQAKLARLNAGKSDAE